MVSIKNFTVAIAGNPNSGKTTLFNQLTGLSQHVGNWPGVTVEKKYGYFTQNGVEICVVDLPGVYSLSPYTDEEKVTIRYLKDQRPDLIINVLDAVNIERNLYLTTQLCQLNIPMVVVLNMADMLEETGIKIDTVKLSEKLGSETYAVSASKGVGIADLKQGILHNLFYSKSHFDFDESLKKISTSRTVGDLKNIDNQSASNTRYKYISEICRAVIRKADETRAKPRFDLDRILTNKYLALPILAGIIILVFYIVFGSVGLILTESISRFFRHTIETCEIFFELHGVSGWISSLVCDGIITGMGTVLSFFPQIVLMFTFLAILEDSGYMSRIVFILDKPMRLIGLGGRS
ncbi:MAG: ferrous iron transporter B, partial [bacterium]|nr:ferrous iron transporter B [bacterium]